MRGVWRTLKSTIARARFERDMREEALRPARIEFGAIGAYKEQCRDESGLARLRPLHGLLGDLKLAARRLSTMPVFASFAILSLAIGVGVTTVAYTVVDRLFWKELAVGDCGRVTPMFSAEIGPYAGVQDESPVRVACANGSRSRRPTRLWSGDHRPAGTRPA